MELLIGRIGFFYHTGKVTAARKSDASIRMKRILKSSQMEKTSPAAALIVSIAPGAAQGGVRVKRGTAAEGRPIGARSTRPAFLAVGCWLAQSKGRVSSARAA
jgi:hypothetical protein